MTEAAAATAETTPSPSQAGAAPANDNTAAAMLAAGPSPSPSPSQAGPTDLPSWAADLEAEDRDWLAKAGHREIPKIIKSTRHLEKMLGADKAGRGLVLPAESQADNPDAWAAVYERLGRPADATGYGLEKMEGADPAFAADAASAFHAAGLNPAQATKLAEWWSTKQGEAQATADRHFAQQGEAELDALKKEWGPTFDAKAEAGRRAARQFGFSADELTKIERAIGTRGLIERMAVIGAALAEDPGLPATAQGTGATNAVTARAELDTLKKDPAFVAAYLDPRSPEHVEAKARMTRLQQQAAG